MPWRDWQFWAATAAALGAALWLLRGVIARRVLRRGRSGQETKVTLTVKGERR